MVKKAIREVMAYVKSFPSRFIASLGAHLSLTSLIAGQNRTPPKNLPCIRLSRA